MSTICMSLDDCILDIANGFNNTDLFKSAIVTGVNKGMKNCASISTGVATKQEVVC